MISLSNCKLRRDNYVIHKYRVFSEENITTFSQKIELFIESFRDVMGLNLHDKMEIFCNALDGIFDHCFPIKQKQITHKRFSNPWLKKSLLKVIDRKHHLDRESRASRVDRNVYRRFRNITSLMIEQSKLLYYSCLLYTSPSPRDKRQSRMPSSA